MDVLGVEALKGLRKGKDAARGARVMVVGTGVTGLACARALPKFGAETIVTDLKGGLSPADREIIARIEDAGAKYLPLSEAEGVAADALVLSPGIPTDDERLIELKTRAGAWMSEIELAYMLCEGRILAVTGTNGKTTTATLAGRILSDCFDDTRVAGNIGDAFIEAAAGSGPVQRSTCPAEPGSLSVSMIPIPRRRVRPGPWRTGLRKQLQERPIPAETMST